MDATAAERQRRRMSRLAEEGVRRTHVLVHDDCRSALDRLRPLFRSPAGAEALDHVTRLLEEKSAPTNVAKVRFLSPFRYPGGKTWLVPEVRAWLSSMRVRPRVFVEPFAGGGIVGLTVAAERLADVVHLSELDEEVASVWRLVIHGGDADVDWLCERILSFEVTLQNVRCLLDEEPEDMRGMAFRTIVKNRVQRGGIMAPGAGLVKLGENGKGLRSRWYPETLVRRIRAIRTMRDRITFEMRDAFSMIEQYAEDDAACFFVDPPYTAAGKRAGRRLYVHNEIDHERLFAVMADVTGPVMMTYDKSNEVLDLAQRFGFCVRRVPMKNSHHAVMHELVLLKA